MSAPVDQDFDAITPEGAQSYTVVIPTIGRSRLADLLDTVLHATGPAPDEVIVVDDRPQPDSELPVPNGTVPVRVLRSYGRGPAAARNTGWTAAASDWIAFLDDDVRPGPDWRAALVADLSRCGSDVAASTARIVVPPPEGRRPTDDERNTLGLADARWITADVAYRRSVLAEVGGFDETFPRAYREDSDLALRVIDAGYRITSGSRRTEHPVRDAADDHWTASVRRQRGNADDAVMLARHGADWRRRSFAGRGRFGRYAVTTGVAAAAVGLLLSGRPRAATVPVAVWTALTSRFAVQRILPGPRTRAEIGRMLISSAAIPPTAVYHRLRGEYSARYGSARHPRYAVAVGSRTARTGAGRDL